MKSFILLFCLIFSLPAQVLEAVGDFRVKHNPFTNDTYFSASPSLWMPHDQQPRTYVRSNEFQWYLHNPGGTSSLYNWAGDRLTDYPDEPSGVAHIDMLNAWSIQPDAKNVIVAIIDSGIDGEHPDLKDNIWTNTPVNYLTDQLGHGTQVAGVIGAVGGDGYGMAGVTRNVKLFPIRVPILYENSVVAAIDEAIYAGAKIIVMSFGYTSREPLALKDALLRAAIANIIVVCAGLNGYGDYDTQIDYPALWRLPNVIMVGGSTRNDDPYSYTGTNLTLMAGARLIVTTTIRRPMALGETNFDLAHAYTSGTSMATPMVAGVVALCWERYPNENSFDIIERIIEGVDKPFNLIGTCASDGRLNAYRSLIYTRTNYLTIDPVSVSAAGAKGTTSEIYQSVDLTNWTHFLTVTNDGFPHVIASVTGGLRFFKIE